MFGHYLSEEALTNLKNYKYQAGEYTWLDNVFNIYWNSAIEFVPHWVAPNLLTLLGFCCSIGAFAVVAIFSPTFQDNIPTWSLLASAAFTFGYQTLDALDGKQARKTRTSSTLGTLFDHGCDIITTTLLLTAATIVSRLGGGMATYITLAIGVQLTQFVYLWWEFNFQVFLSNPGYGTGVTEAQCCFMGMCLCTAIFGSDFWLIDILAPISSMLKIQSLPVLPINLVFAFLITTNNVLANGFLIIKAWKKLEGRRRGAFARLIIFIGYLALFWVVWRNGLKLKLHPWFLSYYSSITYGAYAIRLLLASTAKRPFSLVQWPVLPTVLLGLLRPQNKLFYILCCLWQSVYLADLVNTAIRDMCNFLNINCFTIPNVKKEQ